MNYLDIDALLAQKGKPCLSITIPTSRYGRARIKNPDLIEKAIDRARKLLSSTGWRKDETTPIEQELETLAGNVDYMRLQEGLAIFISTHLFKVQILPFPVLERVVLSDTFEIRDIVYSNQFLRPYYLLAVSRKKIRLFKGCGKDLQEVVNNDFPKKYVDEYEYSRPSIGTSFGSTLKSFERDKTVLEETRMKSFLKATDKCLDKYLNSDMQLFIAGVEEELANFDHVTSHTPQIGGRIRGNFDVDAVHPLAEQSWNLVRDEVAKRQQALIVSLRDELGTTQAVDGIQNVWKAASEGNGRRLFVEKDYEARGYVGTNDPDHLHLTPPVGNHIIIKDAVEEVLKIVRAKGGELHIVENGVLSECAGIALSLRY